MKRSLLAAATALGLGFAALAPAQTIDAKPYHISFRGGIVVALDDDLRDMDKLWTGLGLDYNFPTQYIKDSDTFLSVDYIFRSMSGDRGSMWPIMLCQRFYGAGNSAKENRSYLTAGLGVVVFDIVHSETRFGGKLGVGHEFGPAIFGEANLIMTEQTDRGHFTGNCLGFYLGYRF